MLNKIILSLIVLLVVILPILAQSTNLPPYKDISQYVETRVTDLLSKMTLKEKVDIVGGIGFKTKRNVRLGIPELLMADGPQGPNAKGHSTHYSAMINLAATFDTDLMRLVAKNVGQETRIFGRNMLLAPMINIIRTPFGYGLSYTTFEFSDLKLSKFSMNKDDELIIKLTVKNNGKVDGDEIVQLYISDKKASVEREVKSLKGFKRVSLKSDESKTVSMKIDKSSLSFYDVDSKSWVVEPGEFEVLVGNSSRNVFLQKSFTVK